MDQNGQKTGIDLNQLEGSVPEGLHPVLQFLVNNVKALSIGAAGVLVLAMLIGGYQWYDAQQMNAARTELGSILTETTGSDRLQKLEGFLKDAPKGMERGVLLELASAADAQGEHGRAAGYWERLAGLADDDIRIIARLGQSKSLLEAGEPHEAMAVIQDLQGEAPAAYTTSVLRQLAVIAEAAGDKDAALEAYRQLAEKGDALNKQYVEYKIGRLEADI